MSDATTPVTIQPQDRVSDSALPAGTLPWRLAWRIALRESRASLGRFAFVAAAVAVGVAALVGVRGFSNLFHDVLLKEARTLMAADLSIRVFRLPNPDQESLLRALGDEGIQQTWITESVSMLSAGPDTTPVLVSVKAVEPELYPFYGEFRTDPPGNLRDILKPDVVLVADDLMIRFDLKRGDTLRLGAAEFRVAGTVANEPDRMTGSINAGPRVLMSRAALNRTGLITGGSRAAQRFLLRFPESSPTYPPVNVENLRERLQKVFPDAMISDFRQVHPAINRGLTSATTFLSLVSLVALIVGSLGVGMAMQAQLQQKLDSIAIMKALGARSSHILRIYGLQTLILGAVGALIGVAAGSVVQRAFPVLLEQYFPIASNIGWDLWSALQGFITGVLSTMLFTLPALLDTRRIKPNVILRRDMPEARRGWKQYLRDSGVPILTAMLLVIGIGLIASWLSNSWSLGGYFVAAILVALLVLNGIAWLLLRGLRLIAERRILPLSMTIRQGMGNLHRPGNHAQAALVALGVGVTFTLTVYLVQGSMLQGLLASAPPNMPNVFFINVQPDQQEQLVSIIRSQQGLLDDPIVRSSVSMRLDRIGTKRIDDFQLEGFDRRFLRERNGREAADLPAGTTIVEGSWWSPGSNLGGERLVSVARDVAKALQIELGTRIRWAAAGQPLEAVVVAIHETEESRPDSNFLYFFSPRALRGFPTIYYAAVRMNPPEVPALQRATYRAFPAITVINIADVLAIVQEVLDQVTIFVEFISLFSILAGVVILSASIAGTRLRRIREIAILKTLGATRRHLRGIFSVEFTLLGLVAGIMGTVLALGFSSLVLRQFFDARVQLGWMPTVICIGGTVLMANFAGWLASVRLLDQKPLVVLRGD